MKRTLKCCLCGIEVKVGNYGIKAKKNKKNIFFKNPFADGDYKCSICRKNITPKKSKRVKVDNEKTKT